MQNTASKCPSRSFTLNLPLVSCVDMGNRGIVRIMPRGTGKGHGKWSVGRDVLILNVA